ncbi:MAG: alanine racemase [Gemmatimonadota bacterium]
MTTVSTPADHADRAWVDVDLDAVLANARHVANVSGARLMPMVKANGYGLGAVPVARALDRIDPWGYGVATVEEGAELRAAGVERPIVLFTPAPAAWLPAILRHGLTPALGDLEALRSWLAQADGRAFHLAIDTGMSRAGFPAADQARLAAVRTLLATARGYEGACTHFHSADSDATSVRDGWRVFHEVVSALGPRPQLLHAANSAAALAGHAYAGDLVRPGIYLYGGSAGTHQPKPVAALRALVVSVRRLGPGDTVSYGATWRAERPVHVATLAIGYADGLPRAFAQRGIVRLGARNAPVRGRITMDMTIVETDGTAQVGDDALIFGEELLVDAQAERAGTISYELLTSLGRRVERRYRG